MPNKSRADLKGYFVKNAIPTEGNFVDLVDSQLNQSEDGVFKLPGEPLGIVAAGGDQKRVLRLYANYPASPDWFLSMNPAQNPADPATSRAGLGVTDGAGRTRLFIDTATGRVGIGTNAPQAQLDVAGTLRVEGSAQINGQLTCNSNLTLSQGGISAATGLQIGGSAQVGGAVYCGNSDVYFSRTDHAHTGIGNQQGWAAIENATNYGALMILGRSTPAGRIVKLWDRLEINGNALTTGVFEAGQLRGKGNAGVLDLEGQDHAYIQWFPQGQAAQRKGWIGYGGAGTPVMTIANDIGHVAIPSGALLSSIGIGTQTHGATQYPYETIQLSPLHNLRIWFGTTQRCMLEQSGQFTITFDGGRWVFQNDGNLVKYNNAGTALWALNKVSGHVGW